MADVRRGVLALLVLTTIAIPQTASAQRGVPQNGFPSWHERMVLVYVNRARADPQADLAGCTTCAEKACYPSAVTPVAYNFALNRSARFHTANLEYTNTAQIDSPCSLVSTLSSAYVPTGTCLGQVACACVGGTQTGSTPFTQRIARFSPLTVVGTSLAGGYATPRETFYQWLWTPETSTSCAISSTNFTRYNILATDRRNLGVGHYKIANDLWVQDFTTGPTATGTLLAGGHEPQLSGGTVEFRTNYFDTGAPTAAVLNVDGACSTMTRERGSTTNATYFATRTLAGTTCRRYRFEFVNPAGTTVYLPETGSYGVGDTTCADWTAAAPAPCNAAPTIATAASATPNPVTATTTQLAVLGADDGGEPALSYTWTASGPAAVAITPNGTNAAKTATATFTRAGAYTFTATARDAGNQTATSTVTVTVNQTLTTIAVTPSAASVMVSGTQQFTRTGFDQFGVALATQPATTWTVGGGGTINGSGLFTAGTAVGGPYTVTASGGGKSGTSQVTVTGPGAPSVAQGASASPSPVTSTTTIASVLGASGAGEGTLTYTWTGAGPAAVTFAPNATNAAKSTTVTFTRAGTYTLTAQIKDAQNQTATSSTTVVVQQKPTTIAVTPATAVVVINTTRQFASAVSDQFGMGMTAATTWSVNGGGTVDSQGLFTAGPATGGPFMLTSTSGSAAGNAQVVITATPDTTPPTVTIVSPSEGAIVSGPTTLIADVTDEVGVAKVVFTVAGRQLEAGVEPWEVLLDTVGLVEGPATLEARAFDLAGNEAAVSIDIEIATSGVPGVPDEDDNGGESTAGCGCRTGRGTADAVPFLLVLIALRRKQRRG